MGYVNIEMPYYEYRNFHFKDKMVLWPSSLYKRIPVLLRWHRLYIEMCPCRWCASFDASLDQLWCIMACLRSYNFDGLVQDCSNSIALAMELLLSCTTPSIWACQFPPRICAYCQCPITSDLVMRHGYCLIPILILHTKNFVVKYCKVSKAWDWCL